MIFRHDIVNDLFTKIVIEGHNECKKFKIVRINDKANYS